MSIYTNLSLNVRKRFIRICTLLPGTENTPIQCYLSVHELNHSNDFDALSYAWGDRKNCSNITVNNQDFPATENLSKALQQLRDPLKARRLWIDAVCINQDDADERNEQVSIMGVIYASATCVISWMGFSDLQFDLVEEMQYAQDFLRHVTFLHSYYPFREYLRKGGTGSRYADFEHHIKWFDIGLWSFQFLIGERKEQPEYWQRAWITQEVVRSRRWSLQVGAKIISCQDIEAVGNFLQLPSIYLIMDRWYQERLLRARFQKTCVAPISVYRCLLLETEKQDNDSAAPPSPPASPQPQAQSKVKISEPWPLLQLLRYNRSRLCQDARDKVYSVLGISDMAQLCHPGLVVDYTRSVADVYTGVAQAIVELSSSLDILSSVRLDKGPCELPSWAPDWSKKRTPEEADRPISYSSRNVYSKTSGSLLPRFWRCPSRKYPVLKVWGVQLGKAANIQEKVIDIPMPRFPKGGKNHLPLADIVYRQLPYTYRWAIGAVAPATLSLETFVRTCSMGLLDHNLDDGFREIMESLGKYVESAETPDCVNTDINYPYRFRTMASALDGQCLFTLTGIESDKQRSLLRRRESALSNDNVAEAMVGIAPSRVVHQGDILSLLAGCSTPILLRQAQVENLQYWKVVSPAYIDSLMNISNDCDIVWRQGNQEQFNLI